jgi:hypothetical protein
VQAETVARLVDKAYALIKTYGWTQKSNGDKKVGFCLMGAVWMSSDSDTRMNAAEFAIEQELIRLGHKPWPVNFNDTPGRTKGEVLVLLSRTSRDVRNGRIEFEAEAS